MNVWTVMELQAVLIVLISILALSSSQSCGTYACSQDYDIACPHDESCQLYDNCMTSQSECNVAIAPPPSLSVNCFDTCIVGGPPPLDPSVPFQCCADSILSQGLSTTTLGNYLLINILSLNEPGLGVYRHNTFCNYNIQCPSEEFILQYQMVRFTVEPPVPGPGGTCLDFLRFHFTVSGASVDTDACGNLGDLSPELQSGVHGSALNVDFRSNRIIRGSDFFLFVVCIPPTAGPGRRKRESLMTDSVKLTNGDTPTATTQTPTEANNYRYNCTPTFSFDQRIVRDYNDSTQSIEKYLDEVFPTAEPTSKVQRIRVIRPGVVLYRDKTVVVSRDGKTQYKFSDIKELQVYNRIEGFLNFSGNASPKTRKFPGYGFLQIGEGIAQYYQTLVDPRFLLNDEEQVIVRDLLNELFNRRTFDAERFYLEPPRILSSSNENVNCSINELAELNRNACTDAVRAAANLFLEKDTLQQVCSTRKN